MSQFAFLKPEFTSVFDLVWKAETSARHDPRAACLYARLALEHIVKFLYDSDRTLRLPYDATLAAMLHEGSFRALLGETLVQKARIVKDIGNRAAHDGRALVSGQNAVTALSELFHIGYWLARTYARGAKPDPAARFDRDKLPAIQLVEAKAFAELRAMAEQQAAATRELAAAKVAQASSEAESLRLQAQLDAVQAEIAAIKAANQQAADPHDYDEAATRDALIDLMLAEVGWPLDEKRDREFPVDGLPNASGKGRVDYVLWGADGKPLALIEAKSTRKDPIAGQQQAKLYADCLEKTYGERPLIFYTNGYEHWLWDDRTDSPRKVQGFPKRDELEYWRQRKGMRRPLSVIPIDRDIAGRHYQTRAIRRVGEVFEKERHRKALLVMATGSGKTRTVIALIDQLMRANWVKRVLFLADRKALVKQAHGNFKKHLRNTPLANLIDRHDDKNNDHHSARVCVSTYPTMMNLIEQRSNGQRIYGPAHFDLIVVDEAHRSVYRKYRAIFDYFDSLLLGLTATPRDEIDRDTYQLFDLESGVPTDSYDLDEAVADGFLVPPTAISVPLKFQRDGIRYDDLSDADKERWDELEWNETLPPGADIDAGAVNKWLFNNDTVDKVLQHLMQHGVHVAEGDRLGKTIIFAKNHDHAKFIAERFDANYRDALGAFARVIDFQTDDAGTLIDAFSKPDDAPHIAISVDMLDTGIDVPEVVNLVFFKIVRSKTKFWQMIGRGTRLCPDLFGPKRDKTEFRIFDFCQNFEYFSQNPQASDGPVPRSLSERLFATRADIAQHLQTVPDAGAESGDSQLNAALRGHLFDIVSGMSLENFLVRPHRRAVEHFQKRESWARFSADDHHQLVTQLAGLPSAVRDDDIAAKQFDYVALTGQLALLRGEAAFARCKEQVTALAARLEEIGNVPSVAAEMALILEIQRDEYWTHVDAWGLEQMRRRLRGLMKLVEPSRRPIIFTDFEDTIGEGTTITLPDASVGTDRTQFRKKVRSFLRAHENHIAIQKLRRNEQLTPQDLQELERILIEEGGASDDDLADIRSGDGLGLFIRSLTGLERDAAKSAFADFMSAAPLNANQIEFVNLIIDYLTEQGAMDPRRLYESPFTDLDDHGVSGLFPQAAVESIVRVLNDVKGKAAA